MAQVIDLQPRIAQRDQRRERVALQRARALWPRRSGIEIAAAMLRKVIGTEATQPASVDKLPQPKTTCCVYGAEFDHCPFHDGRRA